MSFHSPQSSKNAPPSNRQILIVIGLFTAIIVLFFYLLGLLINNLIWLIPPALEQKLGAFIVPVYEKQAKPSAVQDTLNQLLDRLEYNLPQKQKQQRDYQVLYLPQSTVNALAIPGDTIVIYRGLLEQVESENELMMILGHELGHFVHRDHLRNLGNTLLLRLAIAYFVGDFGVFQSAIATSVQAVANAQYSQSQETQADQFGLDLLNKTYGHVGGATIFFERMNRQDRQNISFLSTHPAPAKRVKALQKTIKEDNYKIDKLTPLPKILLK
ncbi:M48 family metallopeptidase [Pleurocapsales cyanobacterium LEGE 06147]|nr:M48 family metallopeptidase [Pleurocapsales cyanobacterium LEGE 06147]